jgi:hypothetical protein
MTKILVLSWISVDNLVTLYFYDKIRHRHKNHHLRARVFITDHWRDSSMIITRVTELIIYDRLRHRSPQDTLLLHK